MSVLWILLILLGLLVILGFFCAGSGDDGSMFWLLAIPLIIVTLLGPLPYAVGLNRCTARAELMQVEYSFGFDQGCMVKTKDGWFPIDSVWTMPGVTK